MSEPDLPHLPEALRARLGGPVLEVERPPQGGQFDVTLLTTAAGKFSLKVGRTPETVAALADESRVLAALAAYRPLVAAPVGHVVEENGAGWFLFTCLPGRDLAHALWEPGSTPDRRKRLVALFGETLRAVHDKFAPSGLPRDVDWAARKIGAARANATPERVNDLLTNAGFWGRDARELAAALNAFGDHATDLVFGHGDWCLPNVLVLGETISGVVDWSWGQYLDRRFDLATGLRSLRYNLDALSEDPADAARITDYFSTYFSTFLAAYGWPDPPETLRPFEALYSFL